MIPGGSSGVDLAREIRRRRPGLPIVLTTGYELSATEARADGIALLLKPYSATQLTTVLATHLKRTA